MGLTQSALSVRRSLGSFFQSRPSTEDLLLKWNASLEDAFLEKQDADALCIKTARLLTRSSSPGKDEAEAEFHFGEDAGLMLGDYGDCVDIPSRREDHDRSTSMTPDGMTTPESATLPSYHDLQRQVDMLTREKREMREMDVRSETLAGQCTKILQDNNSQLRTAVQMVSELSGVVKYLKKEVQKQSDLITELKVDKSVLNTRLDAALDEIYKQTGSTTFTMKEHLLITPRQTTAVKP